MRKRTIAIFLYHLPLLLAFWTVPIKLEAEYVPTVINGLTSTAGLIIGFTGVNITMGISNKLLNFEDDKTRFRSTFILLMASMGCIWFSYLNLIDHEFERAVRASLTGLLIVLSVLIELLFFIMRQAKILKY